MVTWSQNKLYAANLLRYTTASAPIDAHVMFYRMANRTESISIPHVETESTAAWFQEACHVIKF